MEKPSLQFMVKFINLAFFGKKKTCFYFIECLRKRARGDVTIRYPGTGKILINGKHDITYFSYDQSREQVSFNFITKNNSATIRKIHFI